MVGSEADGKRRRARSRSRCSESQNIHRRRASARRYGNRYRSVSAELRVQVGALLGAIVIERNRPTNPMSCFDLLRSDSRSSSDVSASTTRHRYLLRPTPVVKQPPPMPHGYGQYIDELAISSSPSRTTPTNKTSQMRQKFLAPMVFPMKVLEGARVEAQVVLSVL